MFKDQHSFEKKGKPSIKNIGGMTSGKEDLGKPLFTICPSRLTATSVIYTDSRQIKFLHFNFVCKNFL